MSTSPIVPVSALIKFDVPLEEVYGISVNIYDSYQTNNNTPTPETPGDWLKTTDNTQVAFISNTIIRVKTGDQNGSLDDRSFTFLVTGK